MTHTFGSDRSALGRELFGLLPDGSVELNLEEACIQTTAKRVHRAITLALIEERASEAAVGPVLEMLESFLLRTDFGALRMVHPELAGGTRCRARLYRRADGAVACCLQQDRPT